MGASVYAREVPVHFLTHTMAEAYGLSRDFPNHIFVFDFSSSVSQFTVINAWDFHEPIVSVTCSAAGAIVRTESNTLWGLGLPSTLRPLATDSFWLDTPYKLPYKNVRRITGIGYGYILIAKNRRTIALGGISAPKWASEVYGSFTSSLALYRQNRKYFCNGVRVRGLDGQQVLRFFQAVKPLGRMVAVTAKGVFISSSGSFEFRRDPFTDLAPEIRLERASEHSGYLYTADGHIVRVALPGDAIDADTEFEVSSLVVCEAEPGEISAPLENL